MNIIPKILLPIFTLIVVSCSTIRKQTRDDKDIKIAWENSNILKGCNFQNSQQVLLIYHLLTDSGEKFDSTFVKYNLCILPIDKKHLQVNLLQDSSVISSINVKGHYSDGYFKIRRWKTKFMAGPLFWSLTDQLTYIGLDKENKLVVVYTAGGQLLLLFFPFMAAQGGDVVYEFQWIK